MLSALRRCITNLMDNAVRYGGVGLGLGTANDIARKHGASLVLTNRADGGLQTELRFGLQGLSKARDCTRARRPAAGLPGGFGVALRN